MHEPQAYCLSKGKEHKKYQFGSKASVVMTKPHGVIVGVVAHEENLYDGAALRLALEQTRAITGGQPAKANGKAEKMRARFRRWAAIEPVINHLKHQYRLVRFFPKGFVGDQVNLLLAAVAWNLKKWLRMTVLFFVSNHSPPRKPTKPHRFILTSVKEFFRNDDIWVFRHLPSVGENVRKDGHVKVLCEVRWCPSLPASFAEAPPVRANPKAAVASLSGKDSTWSK